MEKLIEGMLDKKVWAVVGASSNKEKFGYKVFKKLESAGYTVYPVNPSCDRIDQTICYPSLSEVPQLPDVVNFVVPPAVGLRVIEEARSLDIERVWFQPGAESPEIIQRALKIGLSIVYDRCVLIELD